VDIVIWIALAFIIDVSGPHAVAADSAYKTEAACMEQVTAAVKEILKDKTVLMLGATCVELHPKVTPSGEAVLKSGAAPKRKEKQVDLEHSDDPAHASPFRSTSL
jgi:hypothetical protein